MGSGGRRRKRRGHIPPMQRPPGKKRPWWRSKTILPRIVGAVLLVSGGALAFSTLSTEAALSGPTATAPGVVGDVDDGGKGPDTITVEFDTRDGRNIETEIEGSGHKTGDYVTVEYALKDPTKARFKGDHSQLVAGLLYGAMAIGGAFCLFVPNLGQPPRNHWS